MLRVWRLGWFAITLAACATYEGISGGNDAGPLPDANSGATADGGNSDASVPNDGGSSSSSGGLDDASVPGDLSLQRLPKGGCNNTLNDTTLSELFAGYVKSTVEFSVHNPVANLYRCDDVISMTLMHDPPQQVGANAAIGLKREAITATDFTLSWIVESVTQPGEDEATSIGPLLLSHESDGSASGAYLRNHTQSGELLFHVGRVGTNESSYERSLGAPTPPYRITWKVHRDMESKQADITMLVTDATSDTSETMTTAMYAAEIELTFGIQRLLAGGLTRYTISELQLP